MALRTDAAALLEGAVVVFVVAMVAGQLLGQPVLLGFVTTDSMRPTLDPGDGFVAVPPAVTGEITEGDVVTYRAETIEGGGLTTHRVVETTDRGFVTRGDDNPFTDQDAGEPPVRRAQVVAVAWRPGGSTLAIPGVGAAVTATRDALSAARRSLGALPGTNRVPGTRALAGLLLALSVTAYAATVVRGRTRKRRRRDASRGTGTSVRLLVAVLAAAVVVAATAAMVVPAGPQAFRFVSAVSDGPGLGVVESGTSESAPYPVANGGFVPVVSHFEPTTPGVDVRPGETVVPARSTVDATLTLTAPPEKGYYRRYVVEHRYLFVLPRPVIRGLHAVHPWLPVVVVDALLGLAVYVLAVTVAGSGRLRTRTREAAVPAGARLRRLVEGRR